MIMPSDPVQLPSMKVVTAPSTQCLAIVFQRCNSGGEKDTLTTATRASSSSSTGARLLQALKDENRDSFWNRALVESVLSLELIGFMRPATVLVSAASELHLECLRGAWARRVLKPPRGYLIKSLGDVGGIEMKEVAQTQFVPLPEVLCLLISDLNRDGQPATLSALADALQRQYAGMQIPRLEILQATLAALAMEGKIYAMGDHYFVSTPLMYQQFQQQNNNNNDKSTTSSNRNQPPPSVNWYNDAAPYHMKSSGRPVQTSIECQTGPSVVNAAAPYQPKKRDQATTVTTETIDQGVDGQKTTVDEHRNAENLKRNGPTRRKSVKENEKPGFFSRLFTKRSKSRDANKFHAKVDEKTKEKTKCEQTAAEAHQSKEHKPIPADTVPPVTNTLGTFAVQFPPTEWLHDPKFVKASLKQQSQQHQSEIQSGTLIRSRRNASNPQNDRQAGWAVEQERTTRRKNRQSEDRFVISQQFCTFPENLNSQLSPKREHQSKVTSRSKRSNQQYHQPRQARMSKLISSSSECLQYLGHVDCPPAGYYNEREEQLVYYDSGAGADCKREKRRNRYHRRGSLKSYNPNTEEDLRNFAVTEPFVESDHTTATENQYRRFNVGTDDDRPVLVVPLASATTTTDLDTTTTGCDGTEGGGRTSTPAGDEMICPQHIEQLAVGDSSNDGPNSTAVATKGANNHSDSAFSASPVMITTASDFSHDSIKYSSWGSGSEGNQPPAEPYGNSPFEHTYVNITQYADERQPITADRERTYENCGGHESTQFENVSQDITLPNASSGQDDLGKLSLNDSRNTASTGSSGLALKPAYISQV